MTSVQSAMRVQRFGTLEVRYDPEADALYIKLAEGKPHFPAELDHDRFIHYDTAGVLLGIEILGVSQGVDMEGLPRAEEIASVLQEMGIVTV